MSESTFEVEASMLTTVDNPFNPFTQFDVWFAWDMQSGYNTCSLLDRLSLDPSPYSPTDQVIAMEEAIDAVIDFDPLGRYKRVTRADYE